MIEIILNQVQVATGNAPNGMRILSFIDPTGIRVTVPLDPLAAQSIAAQLRSGLVVAPSGSLPPVHPGNGSDEESKS